MANKVQISISAQDKAVLDSLDKIKNRVRDLKKQSADMQGDIKLLAPGQVEELKKVQSELIKVHATSKKVMQDLSLNAKRNLAQTGQAGKAIWDVDWTKVIPDPKRRLAFLQARARETTAGTRLAGLVPGYAPPAPPPAPPPQPPDDEPPRPRFPEVVSRGLRGMGRSIFTRGARAAGGVGESLMAGESAAAGAGGLASGAGFTAGILGLAGVGIGVGVAKLIGGIANKVDGAGNSLIGIDTLKRQLGDVGADFEELRQKLRTTATDLGMTNQEAVQLASTFTKAAGLTANGARTLDSDLRAAGGFARAFGLDPSAAGSFFGASRRYGVTSSSGDITRLGLAIGDAVAKSRGFAMTEQLLATLNEFMGEQSRRSLGVPNVSGFLGAVAGLSQSGIPGLDMASSAGLVAQINSAVGAGGMAGEASRNFSMQSLSRHGQLDALMTQVLQQSGGFGSARDAFGPGSIYAAYMAQFGGRQAPNVGGDTNYAVEMQELRRRFGGNPAGLAMATANHFGTSIAQAMAMQMYGPDGMSAMSSLQGFDISKIAPNAIEAMAAVANSPEKARQQADMLRKSGMLSQSEVSSLNTSDQGDLTRAVLQLTAKYGQQKTEGSETRDAIAALDRTLEGMANALVPAVNTIRDGVARIAGFKSPQDMEHAKYDAMRAAVPDQVNAELAKKYSALQRVTDMSVAAERERMRKEAYAKIDAMEAGGAPAGAGVGSLNFVTSDGPMSLFTPGTSYAAHPGREAAMQAAGPYSDLLQEAADKYGVPSTALKAISLMESDGNADAGDTAAGNGTISTGLMQVNSGSVQGDISQYRGRSNLRANIMEAARIFRQKLDAAGGDIHNALGLYNGTGTDAKAYGDEAYNLYRAGLTPLPDTGSAVPASAGGDKVVRHEVVGVLHDSRGRVVGTIQPQTTLALPDGSRK